MLATRLRDRELPRKLHILVSYRPATYRTDVTGLLPVRAALLTHGLAQAADHYGVLSVADESSHTRFGDVLLRIQDGFVCRSDTNVFGVERIDVGEVTATPASEPDDAKAGRRLQASPFGRSDLEQVAARIRRQLE